MQALPNPCRGRLLPPPVHLQLGGTQTCPLFLHQPCGTRLPSTFDTDPSDRYTDRLFARLGLLEDAAPLFGSAVAVPRAGVLLALPVLVASGVFGCAQKVYGTLGPAFYGLRTSILILLLMALWRIKRPEGLKEYSPQDLGRVLGLCNAAVSVCGPAGCPECLHPPGMNLNRRCPEFTCFYCRILQTSWS